MKKNYLLYFYILFFLMSSLVRSQNGYWKAISSNAVQKGAQFNEKASYFEFDAVLFSKALASQKDIYLPLPDGSLVLFDVEETSVFHPQLAAKYPNIKSYSGWSADGKIKSRFSISPNGVQAMYRDSETGDIAFLGSTGVTEKRYYQVYRGKDGKNKNSFNCRTKSERKVTSQRKKNRRAKRIDDRTLRTYRMAITVTGEYTVFHGGTVADALAAINATLTRVNEVYETDFGIRFELIPDNDQIIFENPETDPYDEITQDLSDESHFIITDEIGSANFDIGHILHKSTENQGVAAISSVCNDEEKGIGLSAAIEPMGDAFDVDFVAHEIGHQFGAEHTWSFDFDIPGTQAEPGSGTTIMGYAGITGRNDVALNSDPYFHYYSVVQVSNFIETVDCSANTALENRPPTIELSATNYAIPTGTAFALTATATDPDADDVLTYTWEQIDDGIVPFDVFGPQNSVGSNFRSLPPISNPTRYFPRLSRVISNNLTQSNPDLNEAWETVSNVEREMNFAVTVRDNAIGGGQVVSEELRINVVETPRPFAMTSQSINENYVAGSIQEITWNVANTNLPPINAGNVDILLSTDGGNTFDINVATALPNTGSATVQLPLVASTNSRFMVKASDNVFFAVNSADFSIEETATSGALLTFSQLAYTACKSDTEVIIPFTLNVLGNFSETVSLSAVVPDGLSANFSQPTASTDDTSIELVISGLNNVNIGEKPIEIRATSPSLNLTYPLSLQLFRSNVDPISLISPPDNATEIPFSATLGWLKESNAVSYDIEIATDATFNSIVETGNVISNRYISGSLAPQTTYFWRVRSNNQCGEGDFDQVFRFTTASIGCITADANDLPLVFDGLDLFSVTSTIPIAESLRITDVNVNVQIDYPEVSDLLVNLIAPNGQIITLFDSSCPDITVSNINASFDDDGTMLICDQINGISGTLKPIQNLSSLNGLDSRGDWRLEVFDNFPVDEGTLNRFSLEICGVEIRPDNDNDGIFDDGDDLCLDTPEGTDVDSTGCPVARFANNNFNANIVDFCGGNGMVQVSAQNTDIAYSATLIGNGVNLTESFAQEQSFENLSPGTYDLCITGTEGSITYEEVCFIVEVDQIENLEVNANVDEAAMQLELQLSGSDAYTIVLNGTEQQTSDTNITLDLVEGQNTVVVSTAQACQGTYEETFTIDNTGEGMVLDFAANNFSINTMGTCTNDGNTAVTVQNTDITYAATFRGNGLNLTTTFGEERTFENLSPGEYELCITGTQGNISYRESCFQVMVEQIENLEVNANVDEAAMQLELQLSGSDAYTIVLNGTEQQTSDTNITLDLVEGQNTVVVSTAQACQGTYEETFTIDNTGEGMVLDFAANNFSINTMGTCTNDGNTAVTVQNTDITYAATFRGNGLNLATNFGEEQTFENLSPGEYELCITGTQGNISYRESCFQVMVEQLEALGVQASLQEVQKRLSLQLSGSDEYNIEINGTTIQTSDSTFEIDLDNGENLVRVTTSEPCQGTFAETFVILAKSAVFPNPTSNLTSVTLDFTAETVFVSLFSTDGKLLRSEVKQAAGGQFEMDFTYLPSGMYSILITSANNTQQMFKVLKQ